MQYRPEVDGLRALAVLPVIFFHAGIRPFGGGFVGVDVFFVISGYLITSIILLEQRAGSFSLLSFYERRARRILPALFIVMLATLPAAWILMMPQDLRRFAQSLISVILFSSNIYFWKSSGYFDTDAEHKPLLHTWSLSVEEQFYVVFPLLLLILYRWGKKSIPFAIITLSGISLAVAQWSVIYHSMAAFYLLPMRAWELLTGSLVALYLIRSAVAPTEQHWAKEILSIGGLLGLGIAVFAFDRTTPFPGVNALLPVIATALILLFADQGTWVGRLLSYRLLVSVGLISYSAYLWHQPLFAFIRYSESPSTNYLILGALTATFALAYLTWRFVEKPCRNRLRISGKQLAVASAILAAMFLIIGLAGNATKGFLRAKASSEQMAILNTAQPSPKRDQCHTGGNDYLAPEKACEYEDGALAWAVFGDSHAVELAYALSTELKSSGQSLKHLSFSGCIPSFGRRLEGAQFACSRWTQDAIDYLVRQPGIQNVVVTYRIHAALHGGHEGKYPILPDEVPQDEAKKIWGSYIGVLKRLIESGKTVTLVLQAPELPMPIDKLLFKNRLLAGSMGGVEKAWWLARSQFVMTRLRDVPFGVKIVDPANLFCDQAICYSIRNGTSYYFDDDHLSLAGAQIVSREIIRVSKLQ